MIKESLNLKWSETIANKEDLALSTPPIKPEWGNSPYSTRKTNMVSTKTDGSPMAIQPTANISTYLKGTKATAEI